MKRKNFTTAIALALILSGIICPVSGADNPNPPSSSVKLIFIHHSTGGHWLADSNDYIYGGLGTALKNNNYYVSATNYGWGTDSIGDRTDIPNWPEWFTGSSSSTILNAVYEETGQNVGEFGSWSRMSTDPGGENQIIMFKSCFPNSNLYGNPDDAAASSPNDWEYSVSNAKAVYNNILTYFQTRQDKLFVVITAPPMSEKGYQLNDVSTPASERAANARAFNNWLVNDWLKAYPYKNVAVFDYYNVLTSSGGSSGVNDVTQETGNHHRWHNGVVQHIQTVSNNFSSYPYFVGSDYTDDHPTSAGQQKAATEFAPLLNIFYHRWKDGGTATTTTTTVAGTTTTTVKPTTTTTTIGTTTTTTVSGSTTTTVSGSTTTSTRPSSSTTTTTLAASADSVTLSLQERAGVNRVNEYVSFGVPLPRAWNMTDVSKLRLRDGSGTAIPAQFEALARWGSHAKDTSAPVKWVLVGCFSSVSANATQTVQLDSKGPGPSPVASIQINTSTPGKMTVNTGTAQFELNTSGNFNLFNQVTVSGQTLLQSLGETAAIDYEPAGSLSIVSGGTPNTTARVTSATVERQGSLNAIVKVVGSILDNTSKPVLDYTARLHFFAGTSDARVDFTVENNHPVIEGEGGQPANAHEQGAVNSVYIGSLKLSLQLQNTGGSLRVLSEQSTDVTSPASAVRLYQDSGGNEHWNVYLGQVGWPDGEKISAQPRLQAFCTKKGFEITGPGVSKTGNQALGWMSAFHSTGPGITVAMRDFWQNFPKAVEVGTDGKISIDLFPNGSQFKHNFRVGEEKTHTMLFHFGNGSTMTAVEAERMAKSFNEPLFGTAPASWYIDSAALGEVPAANLSQWPLYERYARVAFEPNPDFDPGDSGTENSTLLNAVEKYNFYGWQDYGDVPLDYEPFGPNQAGQMNLKYWYVYGMLTQFCRSADLRWIDLAVSSAWHLADIDYLHIPDSGIQHWSHGAYFGHSQHDEPGCTNPNRNYNSPSVDLFFGVPELIFAYHLTGEQRFLDVALEGLQSMENMSQFSNFAYPVFYRERANLIFAYIEGYRQTGDERWLDDAKTIIGYTAKTSDKGWLNDPENYVPPEGGGTGGYERICGFAIFQVLWSMGRYLDFCAEYGLNDDLGVKNALQVYGDFIINHMTYDIPTWYRENCHEGCPDEEVLQRYTGHKATISNICFNWPEGCEEYLEINDWALVTADALTYAYKYSGQQRFLDMAAKFYQTGTLDQAWIDDYPVYVASKDLVNSLNWGLVYMKQTAGGMPPDVSAADFDKNGTVEIRDVISALKAGNLKSAISALKVLAGF